MVQHESNDFEDLIGHHILSDFKYVLDSVSLNQVDLDKLLDGNESVRNLDPRLADRVVEACRINELLLDERCKVIPDSILLRDLNWLKWLSIHVKMQENPHEECSHFKWKRLILNQTLNCVE